jgi:hypothetical protein
MAGTIAIWGAVTGSFGLALAARREYVAGRTRLAIEHGIHLQMSRETRGEILNAWLLVRVWNNGGRPLAVERVGLHFFRSWEEENAIHVDVHPSYIEFALQGQAIELAPNGPSHRLYTPLGPLLKIGIDPIDEPVWAWARTTNGREWTDRMHPILQLPPPGSTPEQVGAGLRRLRDEAEPPASSNPPYSYTVKHDPPTYDEDE